MKEKKFVVTVKFVVKSDFIKDFKTAILENARSSLETETGCERFDVCFGEDFAECFLYEIYESEAAFGEHLKTAHFIEFDKISPPMLESKTIQTYYLHN